MNEWIDGIEEHGKQSREARYKRNKELLETTKFDSQKIENILKRMKAGIQLNSPVSEIDTDDLHFIIDTFQKIDQKLMEQIVDLNEHVLRYEEKDR